MGLVASQARLMLLTSRKCDIEYLVQSINNRRLRITYQTSKLATDYSDKLNNKHYVFKNADNTSTEVSGSSTAVSTLVPGATITAAIACTIGSTNYAAGANIPTSITGSQLATAIDAGYVTVKFGAQDWTTSGRLVQELDTSDDDSATATYEAALSPLQAQDKKLELDMKNLETQRTAITTELDAVKKIIDDNIGKTFKIFAG